VYIFTPFVGLIGTGGDRRGEESWCGG